MSNRLRSRNLYKREYRSLGRCQVSFKPVASNSSSLTSPDPSVVANSAGVVVVVSEFLMLSLARVTVQVGKEVTRRVSESEVSTQRRHSVDVIQNLMSSVAHSAGSQGERD